MCCEMETLWCKQVIARVLDGSLCLCLSGEIEMIQPTTCCKLRVSTAAVANMACPVTRRYRAVLSRHHVRREPQMLLQGLQNDGQPEMKREHEPGWRDPKEALPSAGIHEGERSLP